MKRIIQSVMLAGLLVGATAWSQQADPAKATPGKPVIGYTAARKHMMFHGPGKWWKDADTVKQIGLSDGQAAQIEQVFMEHRMRLIDWVADLQKQELKLEGILDGDQPDEGQVSSQVDQVVTARGKLEKENALMMLNIRRQLTPDQWKKLQSIRGDMAAGGVFFHRFMGPGPFPAPGGDFTIAVPPPAPPPPQMD